jgi:hypothetical protein
MVFKFYIDLFFSMYKLLNDYFWELTFFWFLILHF